MTKWREDAQPEWPEAASATSEIAADGRVRERRAAQALADDDARTTGGVLPGGLPGIPRQSEGEADALGPDRRPRPGVRDPWREPEETDPAEEAPGSAGHAHDPHEVTVQLDGTRVGEERVREAGDGPGAGAAGAGDRPVFVDESGRRSRRLRRIGVAVALACGVYAVVIVATLLSGNSDAPWLPVPDRNEGQPAEKVDSSPPPAEAAPTKEPGVTVPGGVPVTGKATAPAPGPGPAAPAATARPGRSGAPAKPSPAATRATPEPGPGRTDPTPSKPADPPSTPAAEPTPTVEATPSPTATTGGGEDGGDTGTVADGPATAEPVTETPAAA
ncbi:hypothetical protein [Streptomyces djakartensis]|uniref:hypothetical protein n=1 Tax=Streptomyces djakartensis TaxID=68193 RepID=UPI0034E00B00